MWGSVRGTNDVTVWYIHVVCWISKTTCMHTPKHPDTRTHAHTHTHKICNTYCFSTATLVSSTRPVTCRTTVPWFKTWRATVHSYQLQRDFLDLIYQQVLCGPRVQLCRRQRRIIDIVLKKTLEDENPRVPFVRSPHLSHWLGSSQSWCDFTLLLKSGGALCFGKSDLECLPVALCNSSSQTNGVQTLIVMSVELLSVNLNF
jgi:hypothetical protein